MGSTRGKLAKRRQRRKKRAGFEEAARLAAQKGPGIAKPQRCPGTPSCWIECLQKACVSRRLRRAEAAFQPAARAEKRGIVKAVHPDSPLFCFKARS